MTGTPLMIGLEVWVIYDHPRDYPDKFVLRKQTVFGTGEIVPNEKCHTANTLEEVRKFLPEGLCRLDRFAADDPAILETWI